MFQTQTTTAQVAAYVEQVRAQIADLLFEINPNRYGFHARCTVCLDGFSESRGTVTVGTLIEHAAQHAV